jgi:hypothetical protein
MLISLSRYLALVLGILTPMLETIRRWSTWRDNPLSILDDYILGAFLLFAVWRVSRNARRGQRFLAAAWGYFCGTAYLSFTGQLYFNRLGIADPAPISSTWVAVIKGVGLAIGITSLVFSLWPIGNQKASVS